MNLRALRRGRRLRILKARLLAGETVCLIERSQILARIIPNKQEKVPAGKSWTQSRAFLDVRRPPSQARASGRAKD